MELNHFEEIQLNFFDVLGSVNEPVSYDTPSIEITTDSGTSGIIDGVIVINHVSDRHTSAERMEWTLDDVENLKETLLLNSLHQLKDGKTSLDTRIDIRAWMTSMDTGGFTYRECCSTVGVDPDELLENFEQLF